MEDGIYPIELVGHKAGYQDLKKTKGWEYTQNI